MINDTSELTSLIEKLSSCRQIHRMGMGIGASRQRGQMLLLGLENLVQPAQGRLLSLPDNSVMMSAEARVKIKKFVEVLMDRFLK